MDSISDYFLAPTELNRLFLKYEQLPVERAFVTGNLIVDVCRKFSDAIGSEQSDFGNDYILMTLHRGALVDDPQMLKKLSVLISHRSQYSFSNTSTHEGSAYKI